MRLSPRYCHPLWLAVEILLPGSIALVFRLFELSKTMSSDGQFLAATFGNFHLPAVNQQCLLCRWRSLHWCSVCCITHWLLGSVMYFNAPLQSVELTPAASQRRFGPPWMPSLWNSSAPTNPPSLPPSFNSLVSIARCRGLTQQRNG